MELTLNEVAEIVGGQVSGDAAIRIRGICDFREQGSSEDLLGFSREELGQEALEATPVKAFLVRKAPEDGARPDQAFVEVRDPYLAFALVAQRFHPLPTVTETEIHPTAVVHESAELQDPVRVGPHCIIEAGAKVGSGTILMGSNYVGENSVLGVDCLLHPRATVMASIEIGDRCRLGVGCVIGEEGFGNAVTAEGRFTRIPQIGTVVLENDVEVGANSCVDRATLTETRICEGVKIDNLVMIGHNSRVGAHSGLAAFVGLAGSSIIGKHCMLGGRSGVAGHQTLPDRTQLGGCTVALSEIKEPGYYLGTPPLPGREAAKAMAAYKRLPALMQRVRALEKALAKLSESSMD